MGYSTALQNAQNELLKRRQAAGIETRPSIVAEPTPTPQFTPAPYKPYPGLYLTAPIPWPYKILPQPEIWPDKGAVCIAQLKFVLYFANLYRAAAGLPRFIDIHCQTEVIATQPAVEPPAVKLFGSMLSAIQKRKQERLGQLWALMRAADPDGGGWLHRRVVYGLWPTSPENMRRIIREGERAGYWRVSGDGLCYTSETKLCAMLGVTAVNDWAVSIPLSQLREKDKVKLRALFHDAYLSGRGEGAAPIARGSWKNHHPHTVKAHTGRSRPSQRRYEAARAVVVKNNYEVLADYTPDALAAIRAGEAGRGPGQPAFVMKRQGGAKIVKRLSNDYQGTLRTAKRSRRWLNRRIKGLIEGRAGDNLTPFVNRRDPVPYVSLRRYYNSPEQAQEAQAAANNLPSPTPTLYGFIPSKRPSRYGLWLPA